MRIQLVGVALALVSACERRLADDVAQTRTSAQAIQRATESWRAQHPELCPNVDLLHRDKHLDKAQSSQDAWGREFIIQCGEKVTVRSSGPDRKPDTADDIVVP